MIKIFDACLNQLQEDSDNNNLSLLRLAREEFHKLTGEFGEGEPWFEVRMTMFLEWYLLDRPGPDGKTPVKRYIDRYANVLDPVTLLQFNYLKSTLRSAFKIIKIKENKLLMDDIIGGGRWLARWVLPFVGLEPGDIFGARLIMINGEIYIGRGVVRHSGQANEIIEKIVKRAINSRMAKRKIVDHLDKMKLKLDRYSNVKIKHVYQYPDGATL
jgi:hypothetical protein